MKKISILMPAFNEGDKIYDNIALVRDKANQYLDTVWKDKISSVEIIVVDDGSSDNTAPEIDRAATAFENVIAHIIDHNVGKGAALKRGFRVSNGDLIFFIDADLDIAADHMVDLLELYFQGKVNGVLGSKQAHKDDEHYPFYRKIVSFTYSLMVKILLPLPVEDTQTGFKLFERKVLDRVFGSMLVRRYAQDIELLAIANRFGYEFCSCPVKVDFRNSFGSVTIKNIYNMFIDTLAVFYRLRVLKYYDNWRQKNYDYTPMISVVIPVKEDNPYLRQSVKETLAQNYPNFEVIVLPDEPIEGYDPRTVIIPTGPELPAIKRNMGVAASKGEIIAFLDDDAYPIGNWFSELAGNFEDESIGAVGGPGLTPPEDGFWLQVSGAVYASFAASGSYQYRYIIDRRRKVDDYPTCNLAVRKSVFNAANGFQTNYWPGEDTELCLTITKKLGETIIYDPLVEVNHHRRSLWSGHFKQVTQYALHRGYFVKKFPETSRLPQYFVPSLFLIGLTFGWLSWWFMPLFIVYVSVLAFYTMMIAVSAFMVSPRLILPTMLGIFLTHCGYGLYFIIGLFSKSLNSEEEECPHEKNA